MQIVIRISRHQENKTGLKEEILEGTAGNKEDKMNMKKECQVVSATNLPLLINIKSWKYATNFKEKVNNFLKYLPSVTRK